MSTQKLFTSLSVALICGTSAHVASAELLWGDNFNAANGAIDTASTAGRLSGSMVGEVSTLQSYQNGGGTTVKQNILDNALMLGRSGTSGGAGFRFGGATSRFNWATSSKASTILADGGLIFEYDWTIDANPNTQWQAVRFGTGNFDTASNPGINKSDVDYGILLRSKASGSNTIEAFDNGSGVTNAATGTIGGNTIGLFNPVAGTTYHVAHTLEFTSFAAGSSVLVTTTVDDNVVATYTFTWQFANDLRIDMEGYESLQRIDNLKVSTLVPEPSSLALLGLGGLAMLRRRR